MTFRIYEDSLELLRECAPIWRALNKVDRDLARQLKRSTMSVRANVAEGMNRSDGNMRVRFECAIGSARETRCHLEVAEAVGYISRAEMERAHDLADKVAATLYRCIHR